MREELVDIPFAARAGRVQPLAPGSYPRAPAYPALDVDAFTVTAWSKPPLPAGARPRAVTARRETAGRRGRALGLTDDDLTDDDLTDPALGAPPHAVEEVLTSDSRQGGTVEARVRADLTYFEYPRGAGSIAWCTALGVDGHADPVARVTGDVLRRFLEPAPLDGRPDRQPSDEHPGER